MREVNVDMESALENQIPEYTEQPTADTNTIEKQTTEETTVAPQGYVVGGKLTHQIGGRMHGDEEENNKFIETNKLSRVGDKIKVSAEIRDGWIDVDRALLGDRSQFYPEDWRFRIRPATVDAIRNWTTIDDENLNSIDDVFNEILKSCLAIVTPTGPLPWGNIRTWDRFFFLLLIREYSMAKGEVKIEYNEDCPNCDNPVPFNLTSQSLMYDMPDSEVMPYYDPEAQVWTVDPEEYEVEGEEPITLYLPTLEKEVNIKAWAIAKYQENPKKKFDNTFIKFLLWMAPKISKDTTIATKQIREYEIKFKSWDIDMFSLVNDIINNITVMPSTKLITTCPICGEEVTAPVRFPNGIRDLFNVSSGRKKFGKK